MKNLIGKITDLMKGSFGKMAALGVGGLSLLTFSGCTPEEARAARMLGVMTQANPNSTPKQRMWGAAFDAGGQMAHDEAVARENRIIVYENYSNQSSDTSLNQALAESHRRNVLYSKADYIKNRISNGEPVFFACNYWKDFNGNGVADFDEYVGIKEKFAPNEMITINYYKSDVDVSGKIFHIVITNPNEEQIAHSTFEVPRNFSFGNFYTSTSLEGIKEKLTRPGIYAARIYEVRGENVLGNLLETDKFEIVDR